MPKQKNDTAARRSGFRSANFWAIMAGLFAVGYTMWWFTAANTFAGRINNWIAEEQGKGAAISPSKVEVSGYPLAFTLRLQDVKLTWPTGFGFNAQRLNILAHPWSLHRFDVAATGGFDFDLPPGTTRPTLTVAGQTLRGRTEFGETPVPLLLKLTADGVSISQKTETGDTQRTVMAALFEFDASRPETPPAKDTDLAFDTTLHLVDVAAPVIANNPLGPAIQDALVHLRLMGPVPDAPDAQGIAAWREKGGSIEAEKVTILWGPLNLAGSGTLALDAQMQPEAAFTVHATGYDKAVDAFAKAGWIKPEAASIANLALGVGAKAGPDGPQSAEVPLTVQKRQIFLGPAKIGEVPELKLD